MDDDRSAAGLIDRYFWPFVVAILLFGLAFRLPGLAGRSLWIDELYSEWFSAQSYWDLWHEVPFFEPHPPVYYSLLKTWRMLFGNSELGLRSLSVLASLLTILVTALSGRFLNLGRTGVFAGVLAATFLAANPALIREAQNARPYALQILACTIAVFSALALVERLWRAPAGGLRQGWIMPAATLGLSMGCALWLHNTSLFIALGIWSGLAATLFVAPKQSRLRYFAIFFAVGILALLVWAPYAATFFRQSRIFMALGFWLETKPRDLYSAWFLLLGDSWPALAVALALLAVGIARLSKESLPLVVLVLAVLLVPLYLMLAISFAVKPTYIQRLFVWMVPLGLWLIAYGILATVRHRWLAIAVSLVCLGLASAQSVADFDRPIDDWKAIVAEIGRNAEPGDVVIAVPAEGSIAVDYYAKRQASFPPVVCVPGCYPQRHLNRNYGSNFGAPKLIAADAQRVDQALENHRRVWLVQVSVALYDPKGIVRKRIAASRKFVRYFGNALAKVELFE